MPKDAPKKELHRHSFTGGLCGCGAHQAAPPADRTPAIGAALDEALLHGLFPEPMLRR